MKHYLKIAVVVCSVAFMSLLSSKAETFQVQVGAGGLKFTPANLSIQVGDTVEWTWAASGHTTTSDDGLWDSGLLNTGATFSFTFTTAGTFTYRCTPHGTCCGMIGAITVADAIDTVTITAAQYVTSRSQLTVRATDSDPSAELTASVTNTGEVLGLLQTRGDGNYQAKFTGIANPRNITVTSDLGGTAAARVRVR